jgi:ribosomal protein S18 acetylase RimI-like enzyme
MAEAELTFEPFDETRLADWLVDLRARYIEERVAAGDSRTEAEANADHSLARLLPDGVPNAGQHIGRVMSGGERVGTLWIGPYGDDPQRWWVWDVAVDEGQQGRGYGRRAMLLAETLARQGGATTIGLNVFASNPVAHHLYTSLGYQATSVQMRKDL